MSQLCKLHRILHQLLRKPHLYPMQTGEHSYSTRSDTKYRRKKTAEKSTKPEEPRLGPSTSLLAEMFAGDPDTAISDRTPQLREIDKRISELNAIIDGTSEQTELPPVETGADMHGRKHEEANLGSLRDGNRNESASIEHDLSVGSDFGDDLHLGNDLDLGGHLHPEEEQTEYVEEIVLDRPTTITSLPRDRSKGVSLYGHPDPSEPVSEVPCPGCGALLQCQDVATPGYMPTQRYKSVPTAQLKGSFCQRCHMMRNFNKALAVNVAPSEYTEIISRISDVHALAVLVVDLLDIEGSLIRNLPNLIGSRRPVYIVGNKVDLLPREDGPYLRHIHDMMQAACRSVGIYDEMYVHGSALISARTGYGIENLITKLLHSWSKRGHVFLLGHTNVGKSSLFNALMSSDYCKATSRDLIQRATTSVWPGTTLNLLKFPIAAPDGATMRLRQKRLVQEGKQRKAEEILAEKLSKPKKTLSLKDVVGQTQLGTRDTIMEKHNQSIHGYMGETYTFNPGEGVLRETQLSKDELKRQVLSQEEIFDESKYEQSKWCNDTPGLVNPDQVINMLNQEELSLVIPKMTIKPRTFLMHPGNVMFLSGLGRLDYCQGENMMYVTVFASGKLPVHVMSHDVADEFYRDNLGTQKLQVPVGDKDHINRLPSLVGCEYIINGGGWKRSCADIVLSSIGWVAVTTGYNVTARVRAYTPGGRGCHVRMPALQPTCVTQRGTRIKGTAAYRQRK